jgi:hypothetical protein
METYIYIGVLVIVAALVVGLIFAKRKIGLSKDEVILAELAAELLEYLVKQFPEFRYSEQAVKVISYVADALDFVIKNYEIDGWTNEEIINIVFSKAKEICIENNVIYDQNLDRILLESVNFISKKYL